LIVRKLKFKLLLIYLLKLKMNYKNHFIIAIKARIVYVLIKRIKLKNLFFEIDYKNNSIGKN